MKISKSRFVPKMVNNLNWQDTDPCHCVEINHTVCLELLLLKRVKEWFSSLLTNLLCCLNGFSYDVSLHTIRMRIEQKDCTKCYLVTTWSIP